MGSAENEELIWVSKEFAEKWKMLSTKAESRNLQEIEFNKYMDSLADQVKRDFRANLEGLEEDAAIFTGLMLKVKQEFEKAKNEQLNASYDLWEKYEEEIPSVNKKIKNFTDALTPLQTKLTTIEQLLAKINTYNIDNFTESISRLGSMYGIHKKMVEFLIKNFKVEPQKQEIGSD